MPSRISTPDEPGSDFSSSLAPRLGASTTRYDFRKLDAVAPEVLRRIQLVTEAFARRMSSSLSAYLRRYVDASPLSIEQLSFAEFLAKLTPPTCIRTLVLQRVDGTAVLELSPELAFAALEALLGSRRSTPEIPSRDLTEAEHSIVESALRILLLDLNEAWTPLAQMGFTLDRQSPPPDQALSATEGVVLTSFDVRIGDVSGQVNIATPSAVLKRLQKDITRDKDLGRSANEMHRERLMRLLKRSRVSAELAIQGPRFPAASLAALNPGDVLVLNHPCDRPLDLLLDGARKFTAAVIPSSARRSASLVAPVLDSRVRNHGMVEHVKAIGA